ncbi:MAG: SDR family oxidoreductase [Sphingomonadales bacterium]|nr:SDR family oxidoreductase [Sphingomonadales bacterium]
MDFTGQHVVITGASSGIGRATAERVAAHGGRVTLIARRADVLQEVAAAINARNDGPADWITADVGVQADIGAALDEAVARHGPIDGLFLNAGANGQFGPLADYTDDALDEVMRVNALSLFWALRHAAPAMMARGKGSIVVTGSLASERGMVGNPGYLMSKHAAQGIARAVAMEAAPHGVRCNLVHPGFIFTDMLAAVPEDARQGMAALVPQQRIGEPHEAAALAAFLLSDDASHITCQSIAVDGGLLGTLRL